MATVKYIEMYKDFLALVRKSRVGTVTPIEFVRILNLAQEEVISQMLQVMDLNKKFMDGLLPLRIVSDQLLTTAISNISSRYKTYKITTFPSACRRISRVVTVLSASVESKTNLIKSNEVSGIVMGVFSKPTSSNCYYHTEYISGLENIKLYVPVMTYANSYPKCILEYYITPAVITEANVISSSEVCVFNKEVCTDIVNAAARMYLESVQDARYQTYNNELNKKN